MKMENGKVEEADLGVGGSFVKVMSDEQLELLRRQISLYAVISEQLASMHNSFTSQQQLLSGLKMGSIGYDPVMGYCGNKMGSRQRWSPSPAQLQLLEQIFDKGNGTPTKLKIKEITSDLSQHGQVSETNVYNWFQNRRARSKRKQPPCNEQQPQPNPNPNPAPQQTYHPDYFPCSDDFPTWSQNDCIYGLQSPSWPGFGLHEP